MRKRSKHNGIIKPGEVVCLTHHRKKPRIFIYNGDHGYASYFGGHYVWEVKIINGSPYLVSIRAWGKLTRLAEFQVTDELVANLTRLKLAETHIPIKLITK